MVPVQIYRDLCTMSGKNLRQAVFCRNVLSIVSGTTPKKFESGSDGEKVRANFFQAPNSS